MADLLSPVSDEAKTDEIYDLTQQDAVSEAPLLASEEEAPIATVQNVEPMPALETTPLAPEPAPETKTAPAPKKK